jgi:NAD(P)-dependent dehydrogenase (short-subunit alcohol dehydrogenase family)
MTKDAGVSRLVIITGANGNLGVATVKKFLNEGYRVAAVDGKNDHLSFAAGNPAFAFYNVNLTNEAETGQFVQQLLNNHGSIHAALLLVGGFTMGKIEETCGADLSKMYSLNFETAYFVARPVLQHMKETGYGRIVFIGTRPAMEAAQGKSMIAYSLTKSLLFKLADFINAETKGTNVVASVVVPSTIDTIINRKSMPGANPDNWVRAEQLADIMEFICGEKGMPVREAVYKVYNNA